jgi:hypothetical protein
MRRRGSLLAAAATAALTFALIGWVSSAGSLEVLGVPTGTATTVQVPLPAPVRARPSVTATPVTRAGSHGYDLSWVFDVTALLLLSVALIVVVLLAGWVWRNRWHRPRKRPQAHFDVLPEVSLAALTADAPVQLAVLQEGTPRNAIVACWLRLETAAGQAGVARHPAETSTEFTARVLGALAVDAAMFKGFAGLYREARFSRHELGEPARQSALAALRCLHRDIAASGAAISADLSEEEER